MQLDDKPNGSFTCYGYSGNRLRDRIAGKTSHNVLGTDICVPFIDQARLNYNHPNLKFQVLDFHYPQQLGDMKFDYIVGNGILHHLYTNMDNSIAALRDLLKENGKILFIEPNIYNPYCFVIFRTTSSLRKIANLEPFEMAFSKRYITRILKKHNYSKIEVEYKDFLLPNTPVFLINITIFLGAVLEKIPLMKYLSQSIFISAKK